jgi:hypothetical protein
MGTGKNIWKNKNLWKLEKKYPDIFLPLSTDPHWPNT